MRDGFFYFENYRNIAKNLPDDLRLKFYDALNDYMFEGKEPEDNIIMALITALKPSLDKVETRGGNNNPFGCKGKPKDKESESKDNQNKSKKTKDESKDNQENQSFNKQEIKNKKQEDITISSDKSSDMVVKINKILTKYGLTKIRDLTEERKSKLKERCKSVDGFENFLFHLDVALGESSFLRGENDKGWSADFDFLLQKSSWQKLLEGKYKDKTKWKTIDAKPNSFDIFNQALEEIERRAAQ